MGYQSAYLGRVPVIQDTSSSLIKHPNCSRGLIPGERKAHPGGFGGPATLDVIPRSEWDDRIAEMDRDKSSLWHIMDMKKFAVKYQNGIPYCWSHGVTRGIEVRVTEQSGKAIRLSATSLGCIIKNFRAQGGWGYDAIKLASERGVCLEEDWPENELNRKYNTDDNWARAADFMVLEWDTLPEYDFDMAMTYVLNRMPFGIGLDWWGHLVCGMTPISFGNNKYGLGIDNSWGTSWGDNGRGVLVEKKARGDCNCPRRVRTVETHHTIAV